MSQEVKSPTYHRLLSSLKAIGPYLREDKCKLDAYFFDCLSVCVNDDKAPEKREFWGWWMELTVSEGIYRADYHFGCYDVEGNWLEKIPNPSILEEVKRTRNVFHEKLVTMLDKCFSIHVETNVEELVCS